MRVNRDMGRKPHWQRGKEQGAKRRMTVNDAHYHGEGRGLLLALGGFALLSVGDAVIKTMAGQWAPTAVAATRYAIGAVGLGLLLALREGLGALRPVRPALQLLRGGGVATSTVGFFAALFAMPLADATALLFISPMLTSLLAAVFLGEPARRATWLATLGAFVGVLVVLRPNLTAVGATALLPLLAAVGLSMLMIGNRAAAGSASALAQQFYVAVFAAPLLVFATWSGHMAGISGLEVTLPSASVLARCAVVALTATVGHWLIYRGTVLAGAATVAPMSYVQILVATAVGWIAFGHRLPPLTLLGIAIIIAAGLYLWRAGRLREPMESE